jgi:hypothetical protein
MTFRIFQEGRDFFFKVRFSEFSFQKGVQLGLDVLKRVGFVIKKVQIDEFLGFFLTLLTEG